MKTTILNREFKHPSDGWYMIEALGEHPNRSGGIVQVIDQIAGQAIVNRFNADAEAGQLPQGHEMLVDHEHFSADLSQESRAYGWLQELQLRQDGIYGRVHWTNTGRTAVDGGDYRFFSTEYGRADLQPVNPGLDDSRMRPVRLDGLTLTNVANNRGQTPITNREPDDSAARMNWGGYGSREAWENVGQKAVDKYKAEQAEAHRGIDKQIQDAVSQSDKVLAGGSNGDGKLARDNALNAWFRVVQDILNAGKDMSLEEAWTAAREKYGAAYAAAFGVRDITDSEMQELAGKVVNRAAKMGREKFGLKWTFLQGELPHLFNRGSKPGVAIKNRNSLGRPEITTERAAKILNRLSRVQVIANRLPEHVVWQKLAREHPGLYGLANRRLNQEEALAAEPGLANLFSAE